MKKKTKVTLWVTKDRQGLAVWKKKPLFDGKVYVEEETNYWELNEKHYTPHKIRKVVVYV